MRSWFLLLGTFFCLSLFVVAQQGLGKTDGAGNESAWQTIELPAISLLIPKEMVRVPSRCYEGGCYRFESPEIRITVSFDPALGDNSTPGFREIFTYINDMPAWMWSSNSKWPNFKYSYGATYFSHTQRRFRIGIEIESKTAEIESIAQTIFRSVKPSAKFKADFDTTSAVKCKAIAEKAATHKTNPLGFGEIAGKFLFTSRISKSSDAVNREILSAIKERGVVACLTPEDINLLSQAGASDELIDQIQKQSPPELIDQERLYQLFLDNVTAWNDEKKKELSLSAGREFLSKYWCDPDARIYVRYLARVVLRY